ncbi:MAG: hypothetical protein OXC28_02470 [Defluviicoccus sp.]|nr:hypothetical protein [Defluviicoccus sp.]
MDRIAPANADRVAFIRIDIAEAAGLTVKRDKLCVSIVPPVGGARMLIYA